MPAEYISISFAIFTSEIKVCVEENILSIKSFNKISFYKKNLDKILIKSQAMRSGHKKRSAVNERLFYYKTAMLVAEVRGILPKNFIGLEWTAITQAKSQAMRSGYKKGAL